MLTMGERRVAYLEGLRGLAAMQVVGLHVVTGFFPGEAAQGGMLLNLLCDGHSAVYLFFLISGAVLTPSFARPGGAVAKLGRRLIRLGIPMAVAAVIALALIALMPQAHLRAAELSGSGWLAMDSSGAPTLAHLAREIGLDSILLGYRDSTLFAPIAGGLPPMETSLDAPFWSLHVEFYGSMLVLALVMLRARSRRLHALAVAATALSFGSHPMFLFVIGHLSAPMLTRRPGPALSVAGGVMVMLGAAMSASKDWRGVDQLRLALLPGEFAHAPDLFQFQSQLGALAVYVGVLCCGWTWRALASAPVRLLGRLSFGVYLLHFPIMFTLGCGALISLSGAMSVPASAGVAATFVVSLTLAAAAVFEIWIDRPSVALSRRLGAAATARS